ncbi:hypothetical protein Hdeb2414_s0017g00501011 [Helianthus debilis subsp. tardiflorus]
MARTAKRERDRGRKRREMKRSERMVELRWCRRSRRRRWRHIRRWCFSPLWMWPTVAYRFNGDGDTTNAVVLFGYEFQFRFKSSFGTGYEVRDYEIGSKMVFGQRVKVVNTGLTESNPSQLGSTQVQFESTVRFGSNRSTGFGSGFQVNTSTGQTLGNGSQLSGQTRSDSVNFSQRKMQ